MIDLFDRWQLHSPPDREGEKGVWRGGFGGCHGEEWRSLTRGDPRQSHRPYGGCRGYGKITHYNVDCDGGQMMEVYMYAN